MRIIGHGHQGRAPRLQDHDYASAGVYFITVCSWGRRKVFGRIESGRIQLSPWGRIVEEEWIRTPELRPYVRLDSYVIMPDHLHGILTWDRDPVDRMDEPCDVGPQRVAGLRRPPRSLGSFVARFKAVCTKRIKETGQIVETPVWQRNYYEHIIRNQRSLDRIRRYIWENPLRWSLRE